MKRKDDVDIIISVLMHLMHLVFNGNYFAYILNNLPRKYQMLNIGARECLYIYIIIRILILKYQKKLHSNIFNSRFTTMQSFPYLVVFYS